MDLSYKPWILAVVVLSLFPNVFSECENCPGECKNEKLELAFVIDGSGSICQNENPGCENWRYIISFMMDCMTYLNIAPDHDRVAVIQYGNKARVEFKLSRNSDADSVRSDMDKIIHMNEATNTSGGLYLLRTEVMPEARKNVLKVAVVISDGVSTIDADRTQPEATLAKKDNIRIYAMGVTDQIDVNEIRRISSDPQIKDLSYFTMKDFKGFSTIKFIENLHATACKDYDRNPDVSTCPGAFTNTGCYVVEPIPSSRTEAQVSCDRTAANIGRPGMGQLVSILSQSIQEEIEWIISSRWRKGLTSLTNRKFWTGGHRNSGIFGGKDFTEWAWIVDGVVDSILGPQGCFADSPVSGSYDLAEKKEMESLSLKNCTDYCLSLKKEYQVVGLQQKLCFCGFTYGTYGRSNKCDVPCPGDPSTLCGGPGANSIYLINGAYGSWAPNQPNTFADLNQACGALEGRDDKDTWRMGDEVCFKKFPYICSLPDFGIGQCELGADDDVQVRRYRSNTCLLISRDLSESGKKTWFEASQFCAEQGGQLLAITSKDLHDQVRVLLNDLVFVGKNDIWYWINLLGKFWTWPRGEQLLYTNWGPDEPDNVRGNCMAFEFIINQDGFFWTDAECSEKLSSICAIDLTTPIATTAASDISVVTTAVQPSNGSVPSDPNTGASTGAEGGLSVLDIVLIAVLSFLVLVGIICGIIACCYYNKGKEKKIAPKTEIVNSNVLVPYNRYYEKDDYQFTAPIYEEPKTDVTTNNPDEYYKRDYNWYPHGRTHTDIYTNMYQTCGHCGHGYVPAPTMKPTVVNTNFHYPCETCGRGGELYGKHTASFVESNKVSEGDDHAYISFTTGNTGTMEAQNSVKYGKRAQDYSTNYNVSTPGARRSHETYVRPQSEMTSTMTRQPRMKQMTSRESTNLGLSLDGTRISIN